MKKNKIAVVGERDSVMLWNALGVKTVYADEKKDIERELHSLAAGDFAIIFITEKAAQLVPETLARYKTCAYPAVIPIPDRDGSNGYGMRSIKANIEKAIGADILFAEEGKTNE